MPLEPIIELLSKNTSQLADWQFREAVVEKINEILNFINVTAGQVANELKEQRIKKENDEKEMLAKAEEERIAKEKAESEELAKQNVGGSQV